MSIGLGELRTKKTTSPWSWLATALKDPSLVAIVSFCAIGLLITLNLMLRFPDLGALIAQYNQFLLRPGAGDPPLAKARDGLDATKPPWPQANRRRGRSPAPGIRSLPCSFSAVSTFFRA